MKKFSVNFKVVVVLPVFQKDLLVISQNIRVPDEGWVGGNGTESQGSVPLLSHHLKVWFVKNGHVHLEPMSEFSFPENRLRRTAQ